MKISKLESQNVSSLFARGFNDSDIMQNVSSLFPWGFNDSHITSLTCVFQNMQNIIIVNGLTPIVF